MDQPPPASRQVSELESLQERLQFQIAANATLIRAHDAMAASLDKERDARLLAEENLGLVKQERDLLVEQLQGQTGEEAPF